MDREEHAENSSSRNVNTYGTQLRIESVKKRGTKGSTVQITLEDGSSFFITTPLYEKLCVNKGDSIDAEVLVRFALESEVTLAREKALAYLSWSEHSHYQLSLKLAKKGYSKKAVNEALSLLQAEDLLDDRRFARRWLESRLRRRPEGYAMLIAGLRQRGVDQIVAEQTLNETIQENASLFEDAVHRAAEKIGRKAGVDREELRKKLIQRGFPYRKVEAAVNSFFEQAEDE